MDYEKKYNEALERARAYFENENYTEMADVFPELTESEDERMLLTIIRGFENWKGNGNMKFNNTNVDDILAYLEKQKEQKHDAIDAKSERVIKAARRVLNNWLDGTDCPDVSGDFAELEYAIRKYDGEEKQKEQEHICDSAQYEEGFKTGLEIGLRKQKENPKSTDFIPSDCVSDAKCEDRWHKVEDSLPDNGREVLAKDKLGNTLLARYDGEGWDVSVYDDEDYRCDNGISKWCEIPFEKPKEQKPNIELIQKSWYMEGYHDCEFGYEPKWIIKTGEGGPRYEENPKYGQIIEQKPNKQTEIEIEEAAEKAALEFAYQYPLENGEYGVAKFSFMRGAEWQRQQGIVWSEKDEEKKAYDKGFKAAEEFYCGRII